LAREVFLTFIVKYSFSSFDYLITNEFETRLRRLRLSIDSTSSTNLSTAKQRIGALTELNRTRHIELIQTLLDHVSLKQVSHWRVQLLVCSLLELLNREDVPIHPKATEFLLANVNNDVLYVRRVAVVALTRVLHFVKKQYKTQCSGAPTYKKTLNKDTLNDVQLKAE
jgi:hypothetical protein